MWGQLLTSASVSDCACTYLRSTIGLGIFHNHAAGQGSTGDSSNKNAIVLNIVNI